MNVPDAPTAPGDQLDIRPPFSEAIHKINQQITAGVPYIDILNFVFEAFKAIIPFDRMSIALLNDDQSRLQTHWVRSSAPVRHLSRDYAAEPSESLKKILTTGKPRIMGDLLQYLAAHPQSESTRLVVEDGVRSSLTCPLIANSKPVGVIFFSSFTPHTYNQSHIAIFSEVAQELAVVIEQGNLRQFFADNSSKDRLMAMIVHDLRAPTSVILGFLDLIFEEEWYQQLDERSKNIFSILKRNALGVLDLLTDLSDMNLLNPGQMQISRQAVNFKSFLTDFKEEATVLARSKGINFIAKIPAELPTVANFDPARIKQVLENLMTNARKFSNPNTEVIFEVTTTPSRLEFSITDQGQGIPPEELAKLFKHLGKTSVKPTAGEPSSGLGLFIAKNLVERHGGEIGVESKVNVGSKFHFWLPVGSTQN